MFSVLKASQKDAAAEYRAAEQLRARVSSATAEHLGGGAAPRGIAEASRALKAAEDQAADLAAALNQADARFLAERRGPGITEGAR